MTAFDRLLAVQEQDAAADQLRHRRETLPERTALQTAERRIREIRQATEIREAERLELQLRQRELERDVSALTDRVDADTHRLYSGEVTGTKELQALQDEIDGLRSRRERVEDQVLELLMALEPIDEDLVLLGDAAGEAEREAGSAAALVAEREQEIDDELAAVARRRSEQADGVPEALLVEYERLRANAHGIGVARLQGRTCTGCHLELSAVDVDRIKHEPVDALVHCPECGVILVR